MDIWGQIFEIYLIFLCSQYHLAIIYHLAKSYIYFSENADVHSRKQSYSLKQPDCTNKQYKDFTNDGQGFLIFIYDNGKKSGGFFLLNFDLCFFLGSMCFSKTIKTISLGVKVLPKEKKNFHLNVTQWIFKYRICSCGRQKYNNDGSGVMRQQGADHIAVDHWNDEYSKCPLLSHSCPFIHRRPLFQRST